ncbi:MAG TPA: helix-turn-helix domain-containing protein [Nitrososphaeraceae archaeon]
MEFPPPKVQEVLEAFSDDISVNIFKIIERNAKNAKALKKELDISNKQFYDRIQKLIGVGLVKRKGTFYYATSFGSATFQAYVKIAKGIEYLQEFKIIDSIRDGDMPGGERSKLIDRLVEDIEIKETISRGDRNEQL